MYPSRNTRFELKYTFFFSFTLVLFQLVKSKIQKFSRNVFVRQSLYVRGSFIIFIFFSKRNTHTTKKLNGMSEIENNTSENENIYNDYVNGRR